MAVQSVERVPCIDYKAPLSGGESITAIHVFHDEYRLYLYAAEVGRHDDSEYVDTHRTFLGLCMASADGAAGVPVRGLYRPLIGQTLYHWRLVKPPLGLSSVVCLMAVYDFLLLNTCNTNLHPSLH